MKTALFGGTGFIGNYITEELLKSGHIPSLLVRKASVSKVDECIIVNGDIRDDRAVSKTLENCDTAIYLIGILREFSQKGITFQSLHFEGAKRAIDISERLGVRRFILMSANGAKPDGTKYQRTKFAAEEYLKKSSLLWTIFRPSIVFGDPGENLEFCKQIRNSIINKPFPAPLFYKSIFPKNPGSFRMAPVYVKDLAKIFAGSLQNEQTYNKTFEICGPEQFDWKSILSIIAESCGKKKAMLPAPVFAVKAVAVLFERFGFFPVTRDQITMLMEGNVCSKNEIFELLGIEPVRFNAGNLKYLRK
jgi:nucleoside-diphosphate-sugar epimerase